MREILFRGKRMDNDAWVYGDLQRDLDDGWVGIVGQHSRDPFFPVDPATVGQYTGLRDSEGDPIFEGDILSAHFDPDYPEVESRYLVTFRNVAFTLVDKSGLFCDLSDGFEKQFKVIGNTHDTPRLMGGTNEA